MLSERAQANLIGLLVASVVIVMMLLAAVSGSAAVIQQQTTNTPIGEPCVVTPADRCVDPTIHRLKTSDEPQQVRLRDGEHWIGITPTGGEPITVVRLDGEVVLADPAGLQGLQRVIIGTPGRYEVTSEGGPGIIRLRRSGA
jgi:hypothetical protein